jgi:hypothetical protein
MKNTEYLYDLNLEMLEKMTYFQALQYKANCAKRLYNDLLKQSKTDSSFELHERKFYVYKAWKHTLGLLNEREERT